MRRGRGEPRSVLLDEPGSASPDLEIAQIFSAKLLPKDKLSSDWWRTNQREERSKSDIPLD